MSNQINTVYQSKGIGFCGLLTILFIGLKLSGHIAWSWLWVLSPLWIPFALWLLVFVILVLFAFVVAAGDEMKKNRKR